MMLIMSVEHRLNPSNQNIGTTESLRGSERFDTATLYKGLVYLVAYFAVSAEVYLGTGRLFKPASFNPEFVNHFHQVIFIESASALAIGAAVIWASSRWKNPKQTETQ